MEVGGEHLFYEEKGSGDPVLFVHGVLCDHRCWEYQIPAVARYYRTIACSRRYSWPNAKTGDGTDGTVENNADDVAGLIRQLGIARVHLVGHSFGGLIAAYLTAKHPDLVHTLTLVNASLTMMLLENPRSPLSLLSLLFRSPSVASSAAKIQKRIKKALHSLDVGDPATAAHLFYTGLWDDPAAAPKLTEGLAAMTIANARTIRESQTAPPKLSRADLTRMETPTLVIRGAESAKWDLMISEIAARTIPHAESITISRAGHFCMIENPAEFNPPLLRFLTRHRD